MGLRITPSLQVVVKLRVDPCPALEPGLAAGINLLTTIDSLRTLLRWPQPQARHPSPMLAPLVPRIRTAALTQTPHWAIIALHTSQGQGPAMQVSPPWGVCAGVSRLWPPGRHVCTPGRKLTAHKHCWEGRFSPSFPGLAQALEVPLLRWESRPFFPVAPEPVAGFGIGSGTRAHSNFCPPPPHTHA